MNESGHELLRRLLSELIAAVRTNGLRVLRSGEEGATWDDEAIHDFRVALRRLRTLLRVARRLYGGRRMRAIGERLGRLADATGALRNDEVLYETLRGLRLRDTPRDAVEAFGERRRRGEAARRAGVVARLRGTASSEESGEAIRPDAPNAMPEVPRLGRALEASLTALERRLSLGPTRRAANRRSARDARHLARASLRDALTDVAAFARADIGDPLAMHALRIRFKRLRYAAELFAPLFAEDVAAVAKAAARMQKRLGDLHDLDEAIRRVAKARSFSEASRAEVHAALQMARAHTAVRCLEELASTEDTLAKVAEELAKAPRRPETANTESGAEIDHGSGERTGRGSTSASLARKPA